MRLADRVALLEIAIEPSEAPHCAGHHWGPPSDGKRYRLEDVVCTRDKPLESMCAHFLNWIEDPLGVTAVEYAEQADEPEALIQSLKRLEAGNGDSKARE